MRPLGSQPTFVESVVEIVPDSLYVILHVIAKGDLPGANPDKDMAIRAVGGGLPDIFYETISH